ncbi:MAG: zf-HC2 domain-containing protein [Thermomicrobiales bacterium]
MNEPPNRDDLIREQLEAYALGALDPAEAAQVQEHLDSCPDCRGRLAEFERAAALLPEALTALGPLPPAGLKPRLLAAIGEGTPQESRDERTPHPASVATEIRLFAASQESPTARPLSWRRRPNITAIARFAAAAVVILALGWSVRLAVALEEQRAISAEFAALVSQQEVVLEVVDSDQTVRRVLRTTDPDACEPGTCSYGKLFTRTDLHHVVAMAARLPSPPQGQAYRLWLTTDGVAEPEGTLSLDDKGFGLLVFDADEDGPTYDRAELVLQPEDSRSPQGDVVLRWIPSSAA